MALKFMIQLNYRDLAKIVLLAGLCSFPIKADAKSSGIFSNEPLDMAGNVVSFVAKGKVVEWDINNYRPAKWADAGKRRFFAWTYNCTTGDNGDLLYCWYGDSHSHSVRLDVSHGLNLPVVASGWRSNICFNRNEGVDCLWLRRDPPYSFFRVFDFPVDEIVAVGRGSICAISNDSVYCHEWNGSAPPTDLLNPKDLSAGSSHFCLLDQGFVKCWGSNDHGQIDVPNDLGAIWQLSSSGNTTCISGENGVRCWGEFDGSLLPDELDGSFWLDNSHDAVCGYSFKGMTCSKFNGDTKFSPEGIGRLHSSEGSTVISIENIIYELAEGLSRVALGLYTERKNFVQSIAEELKNETLEHLTYERIQLYFISMNTLLVNVNSKYSKAELRPQIREILIQLANKTGKNVLKDFDFSSDDMAKVALTTARFGLRNISRWISSEGRSQSEQLTASIGEILVKPDVEERDLKRIAYQYRTSEVLRNDLLGSGRVSPFSDLLQDIFEAVDQ